jgi:hypothetical protein
MNAEKYHKKIMRSKKLQFQQKFEENQRRKNTEKLNQESSKNRKRGQKRE